MQPQRQQRAVEIARHAWTVMEDILKASPVALEFYSLDDYMSISFRLSEVVDAIEALGPNRSMEIPMVEMENPALFMMVTLWIEKMSQKYPEADLIELYMVRRSTKNWTGVGGNA